MKAYYNEIDPYCAQWLRNLIAAGHIAPGDVDERSIADVRPDDLRGYTQCHFFAGIAGWSYALRLAGWRDDRAVWTGSCPCQPLSGAGQRKGHADERHLWPAFYRLIAERRPATIFGEQVASADGREWLAGVRADLEALGYAVGAADLCAAGVGAPHIRQRLYWVADAERDRREMALFNAGSCGATGDERQANVAGGDGAFDRVDDSSGARAWRDAGATSGTEACGGGARRQDGIDGRDASVVGGATGGLAEPDGQRCQGEGIYLRPRRRDEGTADKPGPSGGPGDADDAGPQGRGIGPVERAAQLSPWSSGIALRCTDGKPRRVEPGIQPLAHGVRARVGKLRAYGNAIVPQVAARFIEAVMS